MPKTQPFLHSIDYYDSIFFNAVELPPSIALLPNIEEIVTYSQDERLGDAAFMRKYGKKTLARYRSNDLSDIEAEDPSADEADFDEMEDIQY